MVEIIEESKEQKNHVWRDPSVGLRFIKSFGGMKVTFSYLTEL